MKKVYLILILIFLNSILFSIEKPVLKTGLNSNGNFSIFDKTNDIYPTLLKDCFYFSFEEIFCKYFSFKHKIDFDYTNYYKYTKNIDDLSGFNLNNYLTLNFNIWKNNSITFYDKISYLKDDKNYLYKNLSIIQYKLNLKYFNFKFYYSNQFLFENKELMHHKFYTGFYWSSSKYNFLKFKSTLSVNLQNYIFIQKEISVLKSFSSSFEIAIDFNKINFEKLFDTNDFDESYIY